MPKVTVAIPVYNAEKYIRDAIQSVLNQTFKDFELIVVDDCSTDRTSLIVQEFSDSRISYYRNSVNLGPPKNFNRCIEASKGEYISIFHADDVMVSSNLELKIKKMEQFPNLGFIHSNIFQIDPNGNILRYHWAPVSNEDFMIDGKDYFEQLILNDNPVCAPTVFARRECYKNQGGFDARLSHTCDWEMWMRMALHYDVGYLAEPLVKYRWHEGQDGQTYKQLQLLREYSLAKSIALQRGRGIIQGISSLEKKVKKEMCHKIFREACRSYSKRKIRETFQCLELAVKVYFYGC